MTDAHISPLRQRMTSLRPPKRASPRRVDDIGFAPFHLLATEGAVHGDKCHDCHMDSLETPCQADRGILLATDRRSVELDDDQAVAGRFSGGMG